MFCYKTFAFIEKSKEIHNKTYDYSEVKYIDNKTNVKIKCLTHGAFQQLPKHHLKGYGCKECSKIKQKKVNEKEFLKEAKKVHGEKYCYSNIDYINSHSKIEISCLLHGVFKQSPSEHLRGKGCPFCKNSKGESEIRKTLKKKNISFKEQMKFENCISVKGVKLRYDFYIEDLNLVIEFDGDQHFNPVKFFGGYEKHLLVKENDKIKNKYCFNNSINFLRISRNENIGFEIERMLNKIKIKNNNNYIFYGKIL